MSDKAPETGTQTEDAEKVLADFLKEHNWQLFIFARHKGTGDAVQLASLFRPGWEDWLIEFRPVEKQQ